MRNEECTAPSSIPYNATGRSIGNGSMRDLDLLGFDRLWSRSKEVRGIVGKDAHEMEPLPHQNRSVFASQ